VQVSARSQLVPVARAAEIRSGSKGNLLRQLVSANVDAGEARCQLYIKNQACFQSTADGRTVHVKSVQTRRHSGFYHPKCVVQYNTQDQLNS
jgi:hypothetical protein